jgi:subtilisin family serine protease
MLTIAAVLAIGACSDQQEPTTENSSPGSEFGKTSGTKPINVVTKKPATATQLAELAKHGSIVKEIRQLKAVIMAGKESSLASIRTLPFVAAANFDAERNIPPGPPLVAATDFLNGISMWNLDAVNVTNRQVGPDRTETFDGTGVYVAVLDTGLLPTWQWYFPDERIAEEFGVAFGGGGNDRGTVVEIPGKWERDTHSHGTHVTSTVIGFSFRGTPVNGVAPKATIIPVKVLNQNGSGWSSVIAAGIVYVADLKASGRLGNSPVVINMSLGGPNLDAVEQAALDYAIARGVIIVASAGNAGEAGMGFPGAYPKVISAAASGWVGEWKGCVNTLPPPATIPAGSWWNACDVAEPTSPSDFYITDFSSREKPGQDLDVAAPGSWVVGPFQVNQGQQTYFFLGGTSMASPHVAGIAALMAQKNNGLTPAQAETILTSTAIPLPPGCRDIVNPNTGLEEEVCWGADATGSGLTTANAALAATP